MGLWSFHGTVYRNGFLMSSNDYEKMYRAASASLEQALKTIEQQNEFIDRARHLCELFCEGCEGDGEFAGDQ